MKPPTMKSDPEIEFQNLPNCKICGEAIEDSSEVYVLQKLRGVSFEEDIQYSAGLGLNYKVSHFADKRWEIMFHSDCVRKKQSIEVPERYLKDLSKGFSRKIILAFECSECGEYKKLESRDLGESEEDKFKCECGRKMGVDEIKGLGTSTGGNKDGCR